MRAKDKFYMKELMKEHQQNIMSQLRQIKPECNMELSDMGNGWLFAEIFKDMCRFNATAKEWYIYSHGVWQQDTGGMISSQFAKALADCLFIYCTEISDSKLKEPFIKHCARLGQLRYRETMLKDARDHHFFYAEELDKDLYLLNCQNGVLNLKTFEFMEHSPDFLCGKIANVVYDPEQSAEAWETFVNQVLEENKPKIEYLQKLFGYALTGSTAEECCYMLYGSTTRNGKSTAIETFAYMLGNTGGYSMNMRPETLAMKPNNDSRSASSDIARLQGCRFLSCAEPPKKMIFDVALLKTLLGRDQITARFLHQNEFQFVPVFKLFFNTNFLPVVTDVTLFSSGRISVVTFDRHFKPSEQDRSLKDKLKQPKNLSGLLNWCIVGLKKYYAEGLTPPPEVTAATDQYRNDSDKIGCFINECLIEKPDKNTKLKDVYTEYEKWCSDNGFGCENRNNFTAEMKNKGLYKSSGTVNGKTCRNIVKGYVIAAEELFVPVENPFDF